MFKSLIENIKDGIILLDSQWQITYINLIAETMLGHMPGTLVGQNFLIAFPRQNDDQFGKVYKKVMQTQQSLVINEYSTVLNLWMSASVYPSNGGISIYFRDISTAKRAEAVTKQNDVDYRAFLDRMSDGFIALDKDFRYVYVNKKICEILGDEPHCLVGKNIWEVFPGYIGSKTYKAFQAAMSEQKFISNIDYYAPKKLWQENHIYPSPEGLSVFIRDITESKGFAQKLRDQERKQQLQIVVTALEAQEKERTHIGRELHDNVNQLLTATKLILAMLRDHPGQEITMIPKCIDYLGNAIEENRKLAHELVTPEFDQFPPFTQILSDLVLSMFNTLEITTKIESAGFNEKLVDNNKKLVIYRIAQEQCTNIIKHSKAHTAKFTLSTTKHLLKMTIADDGQNVTKQHTVKGIGLKNMEARLRLFKGSLKIGSDAGKGFSLQVSIPL